MCGRYTLAADPGQLARCLGLDGVPELQPRYNIAPTQPVPALRLDGQGRRQLALLRWGLVPSWARDPAMGARLINARGETVHEKPAFRSAFRRRRCLLPADGFYEWKAEPGGKQPYYIGLREGGLFAFAGLWEHWQDPQGAVLETCTIITTQANERLASLHERMPVILSPRDYPRWLDSEGQGLQALLKPYSAEAMRIYPVGRQVNNPRHDAADCIQPLEQGSGRA